jgi:hypothetical protein
MQGESELLAVFLLGFQHPILLAGSVHVMAAGIQTGLHDQPAKLDERANSVANHRGALEQFRQRRDRVLDFDDLVIGRLDARDFFDHGLRARHVAAGGDEGNVQLTQELADEAAGIA